MANVAYAPGRFIVVLFASWSLTWLIVTSCLPLDLIDRLLSLYVRVLCGPKFHSHKISFIIHSSIQWVLSDVALCLHFA